jgi:hypothetical protein
MRYVIRCLGFANGSYCPHLGWYLEQFTHEADNGRGFGKFTPHLCKALVFEDYEKAVEFYTRQSTTNPVRPDGKANRPMTGLHAEFIPEQMWEPQMTKRHPEDHDLAGRMVAEEEGYVMDTLRKRGVKIHYENEQLPNCDDTGDFIVAFAIGRRDDLSKTAAKTAVRHWRELRQKYPKARIILHMPGYGEDPREIWEFPDAARYVRWWARFAGIGRFETLIDGPVHRKSVAFLALCGVFGEALRVAMLPPSTPRN